MSLFLCSIAAIPLQSQVNPTQCPGGKNLVNYGDFESFTVGENEYYPGFASPWNSQVFRFRDAFNVLLPNMVHVDTDNGNNYLVFKRCTDACDLMGGIGFQNKGDNVLIPLCDTIEVDCKIRVKFEACGIDLNNDTLPIQLGVWAITNIPSTMELAFATQCDGLLYDLADNVIGFCLDVVELNECSGAPSSSDYFEILADVDYAAVTHVWFSGISPENRSIEYRLDNVVVEKPCINGECNGSPFEACIDGQAYGEIKACVSTSSGDPIDIEIEVHLQGFPDLSIGANNPDFSSAGIATITGMNSGSCETLSLYLDIAGTVSPSTYFEVPLTAIITSDGITDTVEFTFKFTAVECENLYCPCPEGSIVIGSPGVDTYLSALTGTVLPAAPVTNPLNVTIRGTLVIDEYYSFPGGSDICMDSAAMILIDGHSLSIDTTHIRGCEYRWESISVGTTSGTGSALWVFSSKIEDAQYAVHAFNQARVDIKNTEFDKNYVSLFFNDTEEFTLAPFLGNELHCSADLLPHYDSMNPNDAPRSYAGVYTIGQPNLTIGGTGSTDPHNEFYDMFNGIRTEGANLQVHRTDFHDIQRQQGNAQNTGFAIHASGNGEVFQQGGDCEDPGTVTFEDCYTGIFIDNMNCEIINNEMKGVNRGIVVTNGTNREIDICGNLIESLGIGIGLYQNDLADRILVTKNEAEVALTTPSSKAAAIYVAESGGNDPQPDARIELNKHIEIFNAGAGISLNSAVGYEVHENSIIAGQSAAIAFSGISLNDSPQTNLSCNEVLGDYPNGATGTTLLPAGIRANASPLVTYDCNDVHSVHLGVQFNMDCGNTRLRTTNFENHEIGLHYTVGAVTGTQPDPLLTGLLHGNRWNGNWGGSLIGAKHEDTTLASISLSRYIAPFEQAPFGPQNPDPAAGWFFEDSTRLEFFCEGCGESEFIEEFLSSMDTFVANGYPTSGKYGASMTWMYERSLYRKLAKHPELLTAEGLFGEFFFKHTESSIGQFTQLEIGAHQMRVVDSYSKELLKSYRTEISNQLDKFAEIQLQLNSATDSLELLQELELSWGTLNSLSAQNTALNTSLQAVRNAQADSLFAANSYIVTTEVWEKNEQLTRSVYLSSFAKCLLPDETQIEQLREIAMQCPQEGGVAVLRARALLHGIIEDEFDNTACETLEFWAMPEDADMPTEAETNRIFPNPTQGDFLVNLADAPDDILHLKVYNVYGQAVQYEKLPTGTKEHLISMMNLPQGMYWIIVTTSRGETLLTSQIILSR